MSSDHDAVKRVVDAFERSDWSEIDVRVGSLRVHLSTNGDTTTSNAPPPKPSVEAAQPVSIEPEKARPTSEASAVPTGSVLVSSPSPGIFWHAPEPGAPPFVEVGNHIDDSTTVGIIEVMKLMNHIKSTVAGKVVAVLVANGVAVDKGDPLVAVMPDAERDVT